MKAGIIGNGRVALRFCKELLRTRSVKVSAIYNPHEGSAARFVAEHFKETDISPLSDLEQFLQTDIDMVYIASPHETHFDYARSALCAGKHVLCEKPFVFSRAQAQTLFDMAAQNHVFLMEGIKTAFCPGFLEILEVLHSGRIGKPIDVEAAFTRLTQNNLRELSDDVYGGSFTEFASYNLMAIFAILGVDYQKSEFLRLNADPEKKIDGYAKAYFTYENAFATSKTGLTAKSEGQLLVTGTEGYLIVPSPWWLTRYFEVRFEDPNRIEAHRCEYLGDGFSYEIAFFRKAAYAPDTLSDAERTRLVKMKEDTIARADVMERFFDSP